MYFNGNRCFKYDKTSCASVLCSCSKFSYLSKLCTFYSMKIPVTYFSICQFDVGQNFSKRSVRDGVLIEGCYTFLRLVTLNSPGLIPKFERREIIFNNLEVEFLFNESEHISQPMSMNTQIYY